MNNLWDEHGRLIDELGKLDPTSDEYRKVAQNLKTLDALLPRIEEKDAWYWRLLNNQPLVGGTLTLVGTGWVIWHEKAEVITSRAFGWLRFR